MPATSVALFAACVEEDTRQHSASSHSVTCLSSVFFHFSFLSVSSILLNNVLMCVCVCVCVCMSVNVCPFLTGECHASPCK